MKKTVLLLALFLAASAASAQSQLLFWSGFEGVTLNPPSNCWNSGCWQDLSGTDTATGFAWPPRVGGGGAAFQLLASPPANAPVDAGSVNGYMFSQLQTVTGRRGTPTTAAYSQISRSGCCGTGSQDGSNGSTQQPFMLLPAYDVQDLYVSQWVALQPDLVEKMAAGTWRDLFEWKTAGQDYRIQLVIKSDGRGGLFWTAIGDTTQPTFQEFWRIDNKAVPVPVGQWFKVEAFWHRSWGGDGRVWFAVNGLVVADRYGPNMGPNGAPIDRIMMNQLYSGSGYPIYQWVDDVQIWSSFPVAREGDAFFDPPYAPH